MWTLSYVQGQFKCCRFSPHPDVPLVAAGDAEGVVHLYDLVRRTVRHKLKGPQGQITGLAFSPDGLWLLAGASGMGTGDLWVGTFWMLYLNSKKTTEIFNSEKKYIWKLIYVSSKLKCLLSGGGSRIISRVGEGADFRKFF